MNSNRYGWIPNIVVLLLATASIMACAYFTLYRGQVEILISEEGAAEEEGDSTQETDLNEEEPQIVTEEDMSNDI